MNRSPVLGRTSQFGALCAATLCVVSLFAACSPSAVVQEAGQLSQFVGQLENQDSQPTGEMKTLAVVSIGSYQRLMGSVDFLGTLVGMAGADKIVEAQLLQMINDKGLAAIDKTRPWGVVLQSDGNGFTPLAVLPVKDADALFAVLAQNGIRVNPAADDAHEVLLPNGISVFTKMQNGVMLVGDSPLAFGRIPASVNTDLAALANEYDLGARVLVQNVPPPARQMMLGWIRSGADAALQQREGETEQELAARRQATDLQIQQLEQALDEISQITVGTRLDTQEKRGYFDVAAVAVPDSPTAKQMQAQAEPRTNFAGFRGADAALSFSFVNQLDAQAIQQLKENRDTLRDQMMSAVETNEDIPADMRDTIKAAAGEFLDAFLATAEDGKLDAAGSMRIAPDSLTIVAGAHVKDTDKFVSGLKKLEAAAKEKSADAPSIQWNASQKDGVTFHTLNVPLPPDADPAFRRMVGDEMALAFGIGQESVYFTAGRDPMIRLQQAIDASKAEPNKLVPQMELAISLRPVVTLAAEQTSDPTAQVPLSMMVMALQASPAGRDHLRIVGEPIPNGQRVRFEAEEGALRAVGQAIFTSVMRAMLQGPPPQGPPIQQ